MNPSPYELKELLRITAERIRLCKATDTYSIIALFFYCFIFLTFLAREKSQNRKIFPFAGGDDDCWAAGSAFMRLQMFPSYIFWYHVSLGGLLMMPYAYFCL